MQTVINGIKGNIWNEGWGGVPDLVQEFMKNLPGDVGAESWRQKWSHKLADRCCRQLGQSEEKSSGRKAQAVARLKGGRSSQSKGREVEREAGLGWEEGPCPSVPIHSQHFPELAHLRLPDTLSQSPSSRWKTATQDKELNFARSHTASKWRIQTQAAWLWAFTINYLATLSWQKEIRHWELRNLPQVPLQGASGARQAQVVQLNMAWVFFLLKDTFLPCFFFHSLPCHTWLI